MVRERALLFCSKSIRRQEHGHRQPAGIDGGRDLSPVRADNRLCDGQSDPMSAAV